MDFVIHVIIGCGDITTDYRKLTFSKIQNSPFVGVNFTGHYSNYSIASVLVVL